MQHKRQFVNFKFHQTFWLTSRKRLLHQRMSTKVVDATKPVGRNGMTLTRFGVQVLVCALIGSFHGPRVLYMTRWIRAERVLDRLLRLQTLWRLSIFPFPFLFLYFQVATPCYALQLETWLIIRPFKTHEPFLALQQVLLNVVSLYERIEH